MGLLGAIVGWAIAEPDFADGGGQTWGNLVMIPLVVALLSMGCGIAESAVVGVPHPDFGEVGVAVVIAKAGAQVQADEVIANLKSRLANFKIPKRCFVVDELPRNTMGKVQKNLLREQYKDLFKA